MKQDFKERALNNLLGIIAALMVAGVLCAIYWWNITAYNSAMACNPNSGISRIEWFFGVRPAQDECSN